MFRRFIDPRNKVSNEFFPRARPCADESSRRADAGGGPQRGDHRQENSRPGQGCPPITHLDLRSPIGFRVPPPTESRLNCWQVTLIILSLQMLPQPSPRRACWSMTEVRWLFLYAAPAVEQKSRLGLCYHMVPHAQGGGRSLQRRCKLSLKQERGTPHRPFKEGYLHSLPPATGHHRTRPHHTIIPTQPSTQGAARTALSPAQGICRNRKRRDQHEKRGRIDEEKRAKTQNNAEKNRRRLKKNTRGGARRKDRTQVRYKE